MFSVSATTSTRKGCRTEYSGCCILPNIGSEQIAEAIYTAFRSTPLSFWLLLQIVTLFNTKSTESHCRELQKPHGVSETPCRLLRQFHWAQWTLFGKTDSLICTGDLPKQWLRQIYYTVFGYILFDSTKTIQIRGTPRVHVVGVCTNPLDISNIPKAFKKGCQVANAQVYRCESSDEGTAPPPCSADTV